MLPVKLYTNMLENCEKRILQKMRLVNDKSNDSYPTIGERPISDTISLEI